MKKYKNKSLDSIQNVMTTRSHQDQEYLIICRELLLRLSTHIFYRHELFEKWIYNISGNYHNYRDDFL